VEKNNAISIFAYPPLRALSLLLGNSEATKNRIGRSKRGSLFWFLWFNFIVIVCLSQSLTPLASKRRCLSASLFPLERSKVDYVAAAFHLIERYVIGRIAHCAHANLPAAPNLARI
jgi:hypothetical protein